MNASADHVPRFNGERLADAGLDLVHAGISTDRAPVRVEFEAPVMPTAPALLSTKID